jgi:hypothetical protein
MNLNFKIGNKFQTKKWILYLLTLFFIILNVGVGLIFFIIPENISLFLIKLIGIVYFINGLNLLFTFHKIYKKPIINNKVTGKWSWFV